MIYRNFEITARYGASQYWSLTDSGEPDSWLDTTSDDDVAEYIGHCSGDGENYTLYAETIELLKEEIDAYLDNKETEQ